MNPLSSIDISRSALRSNVQQFRKYIGRHQTLIVVVKANAYGHGLEPVVQAIDDIVDGYQVDDIEELRAIRKLTPKRVLVLGYIQPTDLAEAISLGGELAMYDTERLMQLRELPDATIHLKVDALLGRQGITSDDLDGILTVLERLPRVKLAGVYTHFSNLEDTKSLEHAGKQLAAFADVVQAIDARGFRHFDVHTSSTAGILTFEGKESPHRLVRLGIGLYGIWPSATFAKEAQVSLTPVLRWTTHLAQVKTLPKGHPVGYGLSYITPESMPVGIVPQGYSDGIDRDLSNQGVVLVRGKRCPIIGRVAMNMVAVDLRPCPLAVADDEVVIIGNQKGDSITADEIAGNRTISYEVVARINPLIPRRLVD